MPVSPADLADVIEELVQHLEQSELDSRARGLSAAAAREEIRNRLDDEKLRAMVEHRAGPHRPSPLAIGARELPAPVSAGGTEPRFAEALRDLRFGIRIKLDHMPFAFDRRDTVAIRREVARRDAFYPIMMERLAAWPEIEAVALASNLPFVDVDEYPIRLPQRDTIPALPGGGPFVATVSPEYFTTVATPIVQGRAFTRDDRAGSAPVTVVNETAARVLWPGLSALGQCVLVSEAERCATVIGVAADTRRSSLREETAIQVYVPRVQQRIGGEPLLIVRARADIRRVTSRVREELLRLDPSILYVYVDFPHEEVSRQSRPWQLGTAIFLVFGVLALIVAAVGLYSVMSYILTQRTQEMGVRMALGAQPRDIAWLTLSGGLTLVGSGMAMGLVLAFIGGRKLAPLLFDTSPTDPLVFGGAVIVMTSVAVVAGLVPALRARRIDPIQALRLE